MCEERGHATSFDTWGDQQRHGNQNRLHQTNFACSCNCLGAIGDSKLGQNVADMPFGSAERNHELVGNLLIGSSSSQQMQHLQFSLAQRIYERLLPGLLGVVRLGWRMTRVRCSHNISP